MTSRYAGRLSLKKECIYFTINPSFNAGFELFVVLKKYNITLRSSFWTGSLLWDPSVLLQNPANVTYPKPYIFPSKIYFNIIIAASLTIRNTENTDHRCVVVSAPVSDSEGPLASISVR